MTAGVLLSRSLAAGIMLLAAGCVIPHREVPSVTLIDSAALGLTAASLPTVTPEWWKAFGDSQLNRIVADANRNSPTLAQALARVRVAQARNQAIDAADSPGVSIDADETWQRFSENYIIPPPYGGHTYWLGQATANLHWDLDFWGQQAKLIEQSRSQLLASALDVGAARLALAGSIAHAYVDLDHAWQLIDIATRSQEQREQLLKLAQQRVAAGLDTQIDVKIAESLLPQARAVKLQAEDARELAVHRLAALAGYGADRYAEIARPQLRLDVALPVPEHLPLDLLSRRPDILASRARVEAATAGRAAAHAAFYPDISLKAFVGSQAIGLDKLVNSGSLIYGAGPALHLPIFDAQRLHAAYKGATGELDESVASYNSTVLNAVREAADQLTLGESYQRQIAHIQQSMQAANAAHELAQKRYAAGLATQLVVLNAESRVLEARRDLVTATTSHIISRVTLLLVLGGSFDPAAPVTVADLESSR